MSIEQRWLGSSPPDIDVRTATSFVSDAWGMRVQASPLYAERDRNFALVREDGQRFLLKIANGDSDIAQLEFQNRVLLHLEHEVPSLPVSRLVPGVDGNHITRWERPTGPLFTRLLTWLDGEFQSLPAASGTACRNMGNILATLDNGLEACSSQGAPNDLLWDLQNVGALEKLAPVVSGTKLEPVVDRLLEKYETSTRQEMGTLPKQVIHNDMNSDNVLFSSNDRETVTGIIDFGDMVNGPSLCDLAIAGAYVMDDSEDPVTRLLPLVQGYQARRSLSQQEQQLLPDLVACRLMTTALIQGWRVEQNMDLDGSMATDSKNAGARLLALSRLSQREVIRRISDCCEAA